MKGMLPLERVGKSTLKDLVTLTLHSSKDSAAIKILKGIHHLRPLARFNHPESGEEYVVFSFDNAEDLYDFEYEFAHTYEFAQMEDRDTSDEHVVWVYLLNSVLCKYKDEPIQTLDEAYSNVVR